MKENIVYPIPSTLREELERIYNVENDIVDIFYQRLNRREREKFVDMHKHCFDVLEKIFDKLTRNKDNLYLSGFSFSFDDISLYVVPIEIDVYSHNPYSYREVHIRFRKSDGVWCNAEQEEANITFEWEKLRHKILNKLQEKIKKKKVFYNKLCRFYALKDDKNV